MTLKSMTGFSRTEGGNGSTNWHWELRTVNGKGLDVRLRLPAGYEQLEQPARDACKKILSRGNCSVNLSLKKTAGSIGIRLNEEMFKQAAAAAEAARGMVDAPPPSLDALLAVRGVLEFAEEESDEAEINAQHKLMLADLDRALADVRKARQGEGEHLAKIIAEQIDEIERLTLQVEKAPARSAEAISARLKEQVARLLDDAASLDEQRLYQEAALLAAKADIQEEIERLKAHVAAARDLLQSEEPVGRRFEFLTQEFNREANTICSKSNDMDISQDGLALKAVIDRMREQVQNIE